MGAACRTPPGRQCPCVGENVPQAEVDDAVVDLEGGGQVVEDGDIK